MAERQRQSTTSKEGDVLVTEMTDPDRVPIMKIASAIVTDKGGRTLSCSDCLHRTWYPRVVGYRQRFCLS